MITCFNLWEENVSQFYKVGRADTLEVLMGIRFYPQIQPDEKFPLSEVWAVPSPGTSFKQTERYFFSHVNLSKKVHWYIPHRKVFLWRLPFENGNEIISSRETINEAARPTRATCSLTSIIEAYGCMFLSISKINLDLELSQMTPTVLCVRYFSEFSSLNYTVWNFTL